MKSQLVVLATLVCYNSADITVELSPGETYNISSSDWASQITFQDDFTTSFQLMCENDLSARAPGTSVSNVVNITYGPSSFEQKCDVVSGDAYCMAYDPDLIITAMETEYTDSPVICTVKGLSGADDCPGSWTK